MRFFDSGPAYAFRNGQAYELEWLRPAEDSVVYLSTKDGIVFPFKPGVTWFEVMGLSTTTLQQERAWRFEMRFP
jgi:hypothetical protein